MEASPHLEPWASVLILARLTPGQTTRRPSLRSPDPSSVPDSHRACRCWLSSRLGLSAGPTLSLRSRPRRLSLCAGPSFMGMVAAAEPAACILHGGLWAQDLGVQAGPGAGADGGLLEEPTTPPATTLATLLGAVAPLALPFTFMTAG